MKKYEKKYEDVYSDPLKLKKCDLSQITTDIGLDVNEYMESMKKMVQRFEMDLFDNLVKYVWLARRFHYKGERRAKYFQNGHSLDSAFGVFMKHYIGTDKAVFSGRSIYKIITYFQEFFPNLDEINPFEEKVSFPYKNIGLSYLAVVYQMDDRLEFLNYAEMHKLKYTEFVDYVINYIYSANEEAGKDIYILAFCTFNMPYVQVQAKKNYTRRDRTVKKKYEKRGRKKGSTRAEEKKRAAEREIQRIKTRDEAKTSHICKG